MYFVSKHELFNIPMVTIIIIMIYKAKVASWNLEYMQIYFSLL